MTYVLGFLFSQNRQQVVLIRKTKPDWQAGKLNGVGGKVEDGEHPAVSMEREFLEETGCVVKDWQLFATMRFKSAEVFCYRAFGDAGIAADGKEEVPGWYFVDSAVQRNDPIPNLKWLIPLALDDQMLMTESLG